MQTWTRRAGRLTREGVRTLRQLTRPAAAPKIDAVTGTAGATGELAAGAFVNPIGEGADPSVVRDGERYLWCQSEGDVGVSVCTSDRLTSLGSKHVVWRAEPEGPCSKQVWAPELTRIDGRWYIYFAASDGTNRTHLSYVLSADSDDPLGSYTLHGPLFTGEEPGTPNLWSIDFTVLQRDGRLIGLWSGWPDLDTDQQDLYAAEMASPTEITTGRTRIAEAGAHPWERIDETLSSRALLEGPRVLTRGDRTFVVYSCAASWLPSYKLGLLELTGDDPLEPKAWERSPEPVFASTETTYGVGHGAFVAIEDDWWHVFHSKIDRRDGWRRTLHVQSLEWGPTGTPIFGQPVPRGEALTAPARRHESRRTTGGTWTFGDDGIDDFDYFGHHQYFDLGADGLDLGVVPARPANHFRSAEKVVLRDGDFTDVDVQATLSFVEGKRAAGVLFRTTGPAVGYDAQRGYFACIALDEHALVLGKTDGTTWTDIAKTPMGVRTDRPQTIQVSAVGDHLVVTASGATIDVHDADYRRGSVGLRVVDMQARFTALTIHPVPRGPSG